MFSQGGGGLIPVAIQGNLIGRDKGGPTGVGATADNVMYTMTKADVHGVAHAIPLDLRNSQRDPAKHDAQNRQGLGVGSVGDPAPTVDASFLHGVAHAVAQAIPIDTMKIGGRIDEGNDKKLGWGIGVDGDPQFTLLSRHSHAVGTDIHSCVITGDVAATMGTKGSAVNGHRPTLMQAMTVRRLTPKGMRTLARIPG